MTKSHLNTTAVSSQSRLVECYKRGMHLSTIEKSYDYAHAMFVECVLNDPNNVQFVEAMFRNLRDQTPRVHSWHLPQWGNRALKKAQQQKNWPEIIRQGIELLKKSPWDVPTLRAMAEASAAQHHNEVELVYLKQALDAEPKNVDVNRHCARSLGRMGQFDQAVACWQRVQILKGKDEEATKAISILAEEKLKYPGGRPPIAKPESVPISQPERETAPAEIVLTPRQKLEQAIAHNPNNINNYLELSELLVAASQFTAAEKLLVTAIEQFPKQQSFLDKLNQVRSLRAEEAQMLAEEESLDSQIADAPFQIPWLPIALVLAVAFLALQIFPILGQAAWKMIDARTWTRINWFLFNVLVIVVLVSIRFAPTLLANARRSRRKSSIATNNP